MAIILIHENYFVPIFYQKGPNLCQATRALMYCIPFKYTQAWRGHGVSQSQWGNSECLRAPEAPNKREQNGGEVAINKHN